MCEKAIPLKAIQGSANTEYKLAILSAHRKTSASVINSFILNYPVLPYCDCEPLSEPSMIIRYGQEISLKITVKQAIADAKGEEQISKFRELVIPSTRGAFEKRYGTKLYDNLLEHSINSDIIFGLHNLRCFTKEVYRSYDTKLTAKDLILSPNDPKQLAMLLVCVLYLNHSYTDTVIMNQNQQNAYALHQQIIGDLGLQSDEIVYSITLFWNNELLKKGIVIYDLGDLWCEENNTQTDFDVYQSIIYLTRWTISADSLFSVISKIDSGSVYNNNSSKLNVALVVEDLLPSDIDNIVQRTKNIVKECHTQAEVIPIMPLAFGDKCFIERGYVSPLNTFTAQRFIFDDAFDTAKNESEIIRIIERTEKRYSSQPFLEKLTLYADSLIDKKTKTIRGGIKMSETITPIELRANVLMASKNIVNVLNEPDMKQLLTAYHKELYQTTFEKYERLIKQEYKIAVASAQSSGKSALMDGFVLEYPVLPSCTGETTCVPTILRYGKEIAVTVSYKNSNGDNKQITIPCTGKKFKEKYGSQLFVKLLHYFVECYYCIALDNLVYFTKNPIHTYEGTEVTVDDLVLSIDNPKHIAMLLMCVLCAYMESNSDSELLTQRKLEARAMQQNLFKEMGFSAKEYSVTLFWDTNLLRKGLIFYDLPGLDSGTEAANGYKSTAAITLAALDEVQSMLYVFKPETGKEGLDAISTMMNREAIRSLNSAQARVMVVLNKIDLLRNQLDLDVALNNAKAKIRKFNLDCNVIPVCARSYSEKLYVDNKAVNVLNTSSANELFWDDPDIDYNDARIVLNRKITSKNKRYPGQPFMDELNRYADMAMVINSLEFIESLYRLIRMAKKELFELIDLYSSIGGSLSSTNHFISDLLEKQLEKISGSFTHNSAQRIDAAFENLIANAGFQQADENLLSGLEREIGKLRSDALQDSQKLKQNLNHHIVLYRMKKKHGVLVKVPVNPNYENWCKLIDHIRFFAFSKSFSEFTAYLMDMVKRIEKTSINLNGTIVQSLNTELTNITASIDKEVEIAKGKLREFMGTRTSGGDIAEMEKIYMQTADFYDAVSQRFKNYVDECVNEVEETIGTNDNCQRLLDDLVKEANKNQDALNNELRKITNSFAESLETTGSWFENTHLVESNQLISTIKNDFVFQENWRYQFIMTLGHKIAIPGQCRDAAQFKKNIVVRPIKVLNKRAGNLLDTLKNDNHDGTTSGKVVFYTELLEKLSKGLQGNPDNSFKGIKMDSTYESEFENVKDVSFDELYIDISNKLEKAEG